jgi:hypothetical protein
MATQMHGWATVWFDRISDATDDLRLQGLPELGMTNDTERRTRARVMLRCPLRLYRRSSPHPHDGETLDLSSAGFYCMVREPFTPGESLDCILTVPAENFSFRTGNVNLHCEVFVTRVDERADGYGVACRIEHYSLILKSDPDS